MVTIVIVSVLATTIGIFFSKLLTIQERDREEAYFREKLTDICGAYADVLSVGSSFGMRTNLLSHSIDLKVNYRHETGGVSFETGMVARVTQVVSSLNPTNKNEDLNVYGFENGELVNKLSRSASGNASLIPLIGDIVSCSITPLYTSTPLNTSTGTEDCDADGYLLKNTALGYLEISAKYKIKNKTDEIVWKNVTVGRVVRLWNRE